MPFGSGTGRQPCAATVRHTRHNRPPWRSRRSDRSRQGTTAPRPCGGSCAVPCPVPTGSATVRRSDRTRQPCATRAATARRCVRAVRTGHGKGQPSRAPVAVPVPTDRGDRFGRIGDRAGRGSCAVPVATDRGNGHTPTGRRVRNLPKLIAETETRNKHNPETETESPPSRGRGRVCA